MKTYPLDDFMTESNYLEARFSDKHTAEEKDAVERFLRKGHVTPVDLTLLANAIIPGMVPTKPGPLQNLLAQINTGRQTMDQEHMALAQSGGLAQSMQRVARQRAWLAYTAYRAFMELQPYNALNGILGRALWLWVMGGSIRRTFLAEWHDQSLVFGGVAEVQKGA